MKVSSYNTRRGFALVVAIVLVGVMSLLAGALVLSVSTTVSSASRLQQTLAARAMGKTSITDFYGYFLRYNNYLDPSTPIYPAAVGTTQSPNFYKMVNNRPVLCTADDRNEACFQLLIRKANTGTVMEGVDKPPSAVDVESVIRYSCRRTTNYNSYSSIQNNCKILRFVASIKQASFLDQAYFTNYETVSPFLPTGSNPYLDHPHLYPTLSTAPGLCAKYESQGRPTECLSPAYTQNDSIEGSVFTNDDNVKICGTPTLQAGSNIYAQSAFPVVGIPGQDCPPVDTNAPQYQQASSPLTSRPIGDYISVTPAGDTYVIPSSGATLVLSNTSLNYSSSTQSFSRTVADMSTGVVSFTCANPNSCNLNVSGDLKGRLTIYSQGNITISNNLTYDGHSCSASSSLDNTNPNMLGIAAYQNIIVPQNIVGPTARRCIDAALYAQTGTIYTPGWTTPTFAAGDAPTLKITGALGSNYRATFAGFALGDLGSSQNSVVVSGYKKVLNYDTRMKTTQPPNFLTNSTYNWNLTTVKESPSKVESLAPTCNIAGNSWHCE